MNPEHVEIVRRDRDAIVQWRRNNRGATLDLSGADLCGLDLSWAHLSGADLADAHLFRTNLTGAHLYQANLCRAHLNQANLSQAHLYQADLHGATLQESILRESQLVRTILIEADLTGAKLYGTARDDWDIRGVKCRYVYWDREGKERSPRGRDLEPGEFERLYAQLPTVEYVFENGMTSLEPLLMDRIVQAINQRSPEFELQVDSINARGLQPTIRFTVRHEGQKTAALEAITQGYQLEYAKLQGKYEELRELMYRVIDRPSDAPINIGSGSMVAIAGSSINIQEYIHHLEEIEQAIKDAPADTLPEAVKREALDTVSAALKDVARGKAREAAGAVVGLGARLGPRIAGMDAFQFFKGLSG